MKSVKKENSKLVIKNTLILMLAEKPLQNITVVDICKLANVNRSTFYYYFFDISDCFKSIKKDLLLELKKRCLIDNVNKNKNPSKCVLITLKSHKNFANILADQKLNNDWEKLIFAMLKEADILPDTSDICSTYKNAFMQFGITRIIKYWIVLGMKETPADMSNILQKLATASSN